MVSDLTAKATTRMWAHCGGARALLCAVSGDRGHSVDPEHAPNGRRPDAHRVHLLYLTRNIPQEEAGVRTLELCGHAEERQSELTHLVTSFVFRTFLVM